MEFSAEQIASILQGEVVGNAAVTVGGLAKIEEGHSGALSFLANPKYEEYIYKTQSSICIVNKSFEPAKQLPDTLTLIKVEDAYACFAKLLEVYSEMNKKQPRIESPSFITESAKVGEGLYLGAFAYIGENAVVGNNVTIYPNAFIGDNVEIGEGTIIHSGVKIYADCKIGKQCILHAGVVIGADGFGFAPDADGRYQKVPQIGNVIIEDDVEIGSNTTIDRATIGSTIIKKGVKIDNLIQIAHNVEIGENTVIAAQVGISGSTKIGKGVMMGGQSGTIGHIVIADGIKVAARAGITKDFKVAGITLSGYPAGEQSAALRAQVHQKNLPALEKRVKELEIMVQQLSQKG